MCRHRGLSRTQRAAGSINNRQSPSPTTVVGCVLLAACGDDDDSAATEDTAQAATTTSVAAGETTTTTEPDTTATTAATGFAEDAELLTIEFSPVAPGTYRVDSLGTPFSVTVEGDWVMQPNQAGWTVFSAPESQRPSDRDVVFLRPTLLSDPTDPSSCCDFTEGSGWPLDDIEGWIDNIVDGVVVSGPEEVEVGGRAAIAFDVEIADPAMCGADYEGEGVTGPPLCIGFIISNVEDDGEIVGYAFEPGFHVRVYWVDQGDQPPVAILVGTPIDDTSFNAQADALLETVFFGDPQPHPVG